MTHSVRGRLAIFAVSTMTVACNRAVERTHVADPITAVASVNRQQVTNAVYAGEGDLEARLLRARVDADPSNVDARLALARHFQQKGFPDIALEHCRMACERAPDSVEAHIALAKMLRDQKRPAEGSDVLTKFASAHVGEVKVWAWLGVLRDEANDPKAGEEAHRKALALAPNRDDLLNNLGYCLLQQGRKAEAAEAFRGALKINPQSAIARDNLGLARADDSKEALLDWQSISGPAAAHNNLAASLIEAGRYADARREIQTALNYDPHFSPALENLQLLSELDGSPASMSRSPAASRGMLARISDRWRSLWKAQQGSEDRGQSGNEIASR